MEAHLDQEYLVCRQTFQVLDGIKNKGHKTNQSKAADRIKGPFRVEVLGQTGNWAEALPPAAALGSALRGKETSVSAWLDALNRRIGKLFTNNIIVGK